MRPHSVSTASAVVIFSLYNLLLFFITPFLILYLLVFLIRRRDFRANFWERLGRIKVEKRSREIPSGRRIYSANRRDSKTHCFWIHAVSVGEVIAAVPLVKGLGIRFPTSRIVLSTYTPTGREVARRRCPEVDKIFYFPLDIFPIVEKVIDTVRPSFFLLTETDIWPIFLRRLARKGIPSLMVNGRISHRRLLIPFFYRQVLNQIDYFCMQTDLDSERLIRLGIDPHKVVVTGNMKFAQTVLGEGNPSRLREELGLPEGARLLIAGSTHKGEEEEIIRCYDILERHHKDLFLLVAPRHPDRIEEIEALIRSYGYPCARRSQANRSTDHSILLLDTIGELSSAYALGTFIFVGGSLVRRGGHNVLEPAAWGKPIFFGPHMENYSAIASMLEREGGGVQVHNGEELAEQIDCLARNERRLLEMGRKAASFIAKNQGAVERNLDVIEKIIRQGDKVLP